ncbi:MAG TPA: class I tRNA ligase family protein [Solirubrobacteraceae bacterium]|jgi:methionyl-tRNA synthetase|nr:class I tRNA ligase family protein [Solirubrobacteraceae bacterium]
MSTGESTRRHLLLPMQPTPNGRMHIGHAAGPYLRADALARRLRRDGSQVQVITGTDVYENWILVEALQSNETPEQTCTRLHGLIAQDLANLNVDLDAWINPLTPDHAGAYRHIHEQLVEELRRAGTAKLVAERVPRSAASGRYVVGVWILGRCPECGSDVAGNSCVRCGAGFQPAEILEPRSRLDEGELRWTHEDSWFVDPGNTESILANLAETGLDDEFLSIARRHLHRSGTSVRLSQPGDWGLRSPLVSERCVLTNTFYSYCLYCAQVSTAIRGEEGNDLDRDSATHVVALFGKDNAGIGLVAPYVISSCSDRYRGFDTLAVNHLLSFEGSKCSTSKRHGIWVSELIEGSSITGDELRYCLSHLPLEDELCSLAMAELVRHVNRLRDLDANRVQTALATAGAEHAPALLDAAITQTERQAEQLDPSHVRMTEATTILDRWLERPDVDLASAAQARSWLTGVTLLAAPVTPVFAGRVWTELGLRGSPRTAAARQTSPTTPERVGPRPHAQLSEVAALAHIGSDAA